MVYRIVTGVVLVLLIVVGVSMETSTSSKTSAPQAPVQEEQTFKGLGK
jgi:hypothetical protein